MEKETGEYLVENILSDEAGRVRSYLLTDLFLSFAIVKGGLLPKSIQALGIELDLNNTKALIMLLFILCIYLFIDFIVKSITSVLSWRMRFYCAIAREFKDKGKIDTEVDGRPNVPGHNQDMDLFMSLVKINNLIRFGIEIFVPLILSIYIMIMLIMQLL